MSGGEGRYRAPAEQPPEGVVVAPIHGSTRGDAGWRLPGSKHGFVVPRIRQYSPSSRLLQVLYSTRLPGAQSGDPLYLVLINLTTILVPPVPNVWDLTARLVALESAMGKQGEGDPSAALEARLTALEARQRDAGKALSGA